MTSRSLFSIAAALAFAASCSSQGSANGSSGSTGAVEGSGSSASTGGSSGATGTTGSTGASSAGTTGRPGGSGSTGNSSAAGSSGSDASSGGGSSGGTGNGASTGGAGSGTSGGVGSTGNGGISGSTGSASGSGSGGASYIQHVFVIMEENKLTSDVYNSKNAPYLNSLMATYAYATSYDTVVDPSESNYIWFEAGDYDLTDSCGNCEFGTSAPVNQGLCTDEPPSCANPQCAPTSSNSSCTHEHLTAYLDDAGVSWKAYAEGITAGGSGLCPINNDQGSPDYFAARHVPFVFFQDISGNPPSATNAFCSAHIVSFTNLATDLASGTLASYVFITPDLVDNMHTDCATCTGTAGEVTSGDDWLKNTAAIQSLLTYVSTASNHSILIIDWDEGAEPKAQPMLMIAPVSTLVTGPNATAFTHSSDLKSLQEIFQVDPGHGYPLLRHAGDTGTNDFASFFKAGYFP